MSEKANVTKRPLSPHLQVYKPQMTSVMSILHRMTGAALAVGIIMVIWLLVAAASGPEAYEQFRNFIAAWYGQLMLFGWTVALCYHLCNGIRHFFWDMGYLFKLENAFKAGYLVLAMTVILTSLVWCCSMPWGN